MPLDPQQPVGPSPERPIEWAVSASPVDYPAAVAFMEQRAKLIAEGRAHELVWLCEHPPLYTAGTSAKPQDLLDPSRFPVHTTGRGGQYTYHGPGQRIVYVMLDVRRRFNDVRAFVSFLENWTIEVLDSFEVAAERRPDRVGVWVRRPGKALDAEDKIAAIGIRLRRWVSYHGIAINVNPDLEHFSGIVPCGIRGHGVTSLADLNVRAGMADLDAALRLTLSARFPDIRDVRLPALYATHESALDTASVDRERT
jgi:lipoyl(octanoyl) transferase